ncbi:AraC family transcriptional regulator [Nocardia sp. NPDC051030]|uniref:AraC family transcriptional regulator n=1 Tax=Nocardia sp. NPDC051030 TaxID=3155162 RepID=UPI00341E3960
MPAYTVPIDTVRMFVQAAGHQGVDLDQAGTELWLREAGISPELLTEDRSRVTPEQLGLLVLGLWRRTGDEFFGLAPKPLPRGSFRLWTAALIACPDLRTALLRGQDLARALPALPPGRIVIGPELTRIEMDFSVWDRSPSLAIDFILMFLHRILGWGIGQRIPLYGVEVPYPRPASVEAYESMFGGPMRFDAPCATLVIGSAQLDAPVVRDAAALEVFLGEAPMNVLTRRDYGASETDRVRAILAHGVGGAWSTPEDIATRLNTSVPTLRRKLAEEGTSCREIKEDIRRDAAIAALVRGDESINDLAHRLGFSEPSAFHRAFRRWTGSAPGAYRITLGTNSSDE